MDKIIAQEIMTRNPASVRVTATVGQALELLQELEIRHLPVLNEDREVVGMVSDRDFRGLPIANLLGGSGRVHLEAPIADIMSGDVASIDPDTELGEIIDTMIELKIGALPVVDVDDATLQGIVSYVDVLRELRKQL